jgi:dTDP-4-dehydrorhamnose reductase
MLGHMLARVLAPDHFVIGTTLSQYNERTHLVRILSRDNWIDQVDVRSLPMVEKVIRDSNPDVIINCVGLIKQKMNSGNDAEAIHINSLFPHQRAQICEDTNSRLIHFSTDCVFNGKPGIKLVTDTPNATDLYGLSKLLGEVDDGTCITLRTSVVGRQLYGAESLFEWARSQRGNQINGFTNAIYSGMTTMALSKIIKTVIEEHPQLVGIHQVASSPISKFELISKLNHLLELGLTINPDIDFHCDRTLDGTRFTESTKIAIPSWDDMLAEFAADQSFYN